MYELVYISDRNVVENTARMWHANLILLMVNIFDAEFIKKKCGNIKLSDGVQENKYK